MLVFAHPGTKATGILDPSVADAVKEVDLVARESAYGIAGEKREHGIGKVQSRAIPQMCAS